MRSDAPVFNPAPPTWWPTHEVSSQSQLGYALGTTPSIAADQVLAALGAFQPFEDMGQLSSNDEEERQSGKASVDGNAGPKGRLTRSQKTEAKAAAIQRLMTAARVAANRASATETRIAQQEAEILELRAGLTAPSASSSADPLAGHLHYELIRDFLDRLSCAAQVLGPLHSRANGIDEPPPKSLDKFRRNVALHALEIQTGPVSELSTTQLKDAKLHPVPHPILHSTLWSKGSKASSTNFQEKRATAFSFPLSTHTLVQLPVHLCVHGRVQQTQFTTLNGKTFSTARLHPHKQTLTFQRAAPPLTHRRRLHLDSGDQASCQFVALKNLSAIK